MGNKTKVGLLLVAALILVIAAPAFAADSSPIATPEPAPGAPVATAATATDANGAAVAITTSADVPAAIVDSAQASLGIQAGQSLQVVDIAISGGTPPYKITIPAGEAKSAIIYHYVNGQWEELPTQIVNGEIVAWTNSASPFAIVSSDRADLPVVAPAGIAQASVIIPDTTKTPLGTFITLPAGTTYYDMVNGAPGAAHTLTKATQVQVIERLSNGYTKILMNNMTYLIKTAGGAVTTTTGKSPKTGAESDMAMMLLIAGAALASVAVFAGRKALKAQD